ncbi:MAG: hypothetical protein GX241_01035 [Ruminococcaceae bacterium]|nr:hypothetical protein [Oscillospiraceae bacterium]
MKEKKTTAKEEIIGQNESVIGKENASKDDNLKEYEEFTVAMALVDALPVLFFAGSGIIVSTALAGTGHTFWIVLTGALLITLGGFCKVLWKLLLGLDKGDVKVFNKVFVPFMAGGFFITLAGVIFGTFKKTICWASALKSVTSIPAVFFFILGFIGMGFMILYRKKYDRETFRTDAKKNWIAQFTNLFAQGMIFLGFLFAKLFK